MHPAAVLVVGVGLSLAGCQMMDPPTTAAPPATGYLSTSPDARVVNLSGYAWDPEAYFFTLASGAQAGLPPVMVSGVPTLERALVGSARIAVIDPVAHGAVGEAGPTAAGGAFEVMGLARHEQTPLLLQASLSTDALAGGDVLRPVGPPSVPMVPAAGYLPTLSLRPIVTRSNVCAGQRAALVSDGGILDAVAKHLSAAGTATSVADLIDPARFGGVGVFWMYAPSPPSVRAPAAETRVTADRGEVVVIDWAPPGALPPEVQSARGFFVTDAPSSPIGVSVVLLPPGPPAPVTIGAEDQATGVGHPFAFPALPPQVLPPGVVSFSELPAILPGLPTPPAWTCLP